MCYFGFFFLHLITVALMFIIELCSYAYLTLGGTVSPLYFVSDVFIFLTRILQTNLKFTFTLLII